MLKQTPLNKKRVLWDACKKNCYLCEIREIHIGNRETCILKWLSLPSGVRKTQFAEV